MLDDSLALTVASWRGMGPRIKSGAGPVSRSLRSLGRGHELLSLSCDQIRIPGRPRLVARGESVVHAERETKIESPLMSPPHATIYRPQASPATMHRYYDYVLRTGPYRNTTNQAADCLPGKLAWNEWTNKGYYACYPGCDPTKPGYCCSSSARYHSLRWRRRRRFS